MTPGPEAGPTRAIYLFGLALADRLGGDVDGPPVRASAGGVAAVGTEVDARDFCGPGSEERLKDVAWVAPRARHHAEVLDRVMRTSPVLPARFGTLFSSAERLASWLVEHAANARRALLALEGRAEWVLRATLDRERAEGRRFSELLEENEASLPAASGSRYMAERRLRRRAAAETDDRRRELRAHILEELRGYADEDRAGRARPVAQEAAGDPMLNRALLLDSSRTEEFLERIRELNAELEAAGVRLDVTGPWPPFSFCPPLKEDAIA